MIDLADLKRLGSDRQYQEWVRHQPSCIDGNFDWDSEKGEPRCEPAHVRRAGESGTGYRGLYAVVPLTHQQHKHQHRWGEAACLNRFLGGHWTPETASEWFDNKRTEYVMKWAQHKRGEA